MLDSSIPLVSLGRSSQSDTYAFHDSSLLVRVEGVRVTPATSSDIASLGLAEAFRSRLELYCNVKAAAVQLTSLPVLPAGYEMRPLRSLYDVLSERQIEQATTGYQVMLWDRGSRYCGACGGENLPKEGEKGKHCERCRTVVFPRISPATITAVIRDRTILLAHNRRFREGMYSLVAGFVEPGESLEECVRREVREEVGISVTDIAYFGSQPWPFPDALMVGFTAKHHSREIEVDGEEITDAQWFGPRDLPSIPAPGSISRRIIDWFVAKYS